MAKDGWVLNEGPVITRSLLEMRSYVYETMQYERLFPGDGSLVLLSAIFELDATPAYGREV